MRRLGILTVVLAAAIGTAAAQTGDPAFDSIVGDPVAYRRVLDKFESGIVRPSVAECTIAYYGLPCQKDFEAITALVTESETQMQQAVMAGDFEAAYALGQRVLETSPVNLSALYWTYAAAVETGEPWEVRNLLRGRYNAIVHVITLSGSGLAPESALRVICEGDMYTYAGMELGLEIGERFLWDDRWTELEVTPSAQFRHGSIFFEIWHRR